jgi:glycosyltransferase involved in cell wall biosynthesis
LYLEECLDSVLGQRGGDIAHNQVEVICVNDGSTDKDTKNILKKYEKGNLKVFEHAKNRGVSAARNTIIENSQGKKLIFVDSDDYLRGTYHLQTLYDLSCSAPGCGLAAGRMWKKCDGKGIYVPEKWNEYNPDHELRFEGRQSILLWCDLQISSCNKLFDLQTVRDKNIRFDTSYTYFEDAKFVAEYALKMPFQLALYTPDTKYVYRKHPASAVNKLESAERGMRLVEFYANQMCYYMDLLEKIQKEFGVASWAYKQILEQLLKNIGRMRKAHTSEHTRRLMESILQWLPQQCPGCSTACSTDCENHKTMNLCLAKAKQLFSERGK